MAWQTRSAKQKYFTSSRRSGGRVIREYYGKGHIADLADSICTLQARKTAELAAEWRRETARLSEVDAPLETLCQLTNELVRATLLTLAFRKHPTKWKFIKMREIPFEPPGKDLEGFQLADLIRRAEEADGTALATIRKMLRKSDVWEGAWSAAELACRIVVNAMAGTNSTLATAIEGTLAALRKDCTSKSASRLEKLLVERLAIAWLSVIYAEALAIESPERELTDAQKIYFQRRVTEARKRHALADKLLAIAGKKVKA